MYFYPQLRGSSGIQKGITMTGVVILPGFVATLVGASGTIEGWSSQIVWSLQAFGVCMLLGVVLGDLGALRVAGRRAQSLIEIYNLGTLAAWTSSLALAIGVVTTTSVTEQAASLLKEGFKQMVAPQVLEKPAVQKPALDAKPAATAQ